MPILKGVLTTQFVNCSNCSKRTASAALRNGILESNVEWRGRSYASSVPCENPEFTDIRRRLSKDERRVLVESFVNKYRVTNAGKFPSLRATCKEVGGSFYVVREIFQELKFESKTSLSSSRAKTLIRDGKSLSEAQVISRAVAGIQNDACETKDTYYKDMDADRRLQISMYSEGDSSNDVSDPTSPAGNSGLPEPRNIQLSGDQIDISHSSPSEAEGVSWPDNSDIIAVGAHQLKRETETVSSRYHEREEDDLSHHLETETKVFSDACFKNADLDVEQSTSENFRTSDCLKLKKDPVGMSDLGSVNSDKRNEQAISENLMHPDSREPNLEHYQESTDLRNDEHKITSSKKKAVVELLSDFDDRENKIQQYQGSTAVEKKARDIPGRQTGDAQNPKRSNLWSNLKSLADGLINIWRKR